jgi:aspartate carbamoyltransferase regulatory subunit
MNESNLTKFFGGTPFIKILDALIDNIGESYTKKEIQELSSISKGTFFKHWPKIEKLNIVKITRVIGNTKLYTLNKNSQMVKDLLKLEARMIEETTPKKAVLSAS